MTRILTDFVTGFVHAIGVAFLTIFGLVWLA